MALHGHTPAQRKRIRGKSAAARAKAPGQRKKRAGSVIGTRTGTFMPRTGGTSPTGPGPSLTVQRRVRAAPGKSATKRRASATGNLKSAPGTRASGTARRRNAARKARRKS